MIEHSVIAVILTHEPLRRWTQWETNLWNLSLFLLSLYLFVSPFLSLSLSAECVSSGCVFVFFCSRNLSLGGVSTQCPCRSE